MASGGSFTFNPRNADDIFSEFFGEGSTSVPSTKGATINRRNANDVFSEFFGEGSTRMPPTKGAATNPRNAEDVFSGFFGSSGGEGSARKGAAIERTLPCSLEDLYKGTTKKMKISRDVTDAFGRPTTVEEILTIEIKPGWKKGTKITFSEKGNEQRGVIPSDLVFIIDEKPHDVFKRDGNDLVSTQRISLVEALTDYTAQLTTLDGRSLAVPVTSVINPTYEEVVRGEGMPIPKEPTKKGNLRVKFIIKFPTRLNAEQKTMIKRALTA